MTIAPIYEFDSSVIIDASRNVVNSPKLLQRTLKRRESRMRQAALKIVAVYPGPPKPGITRKMTPRQRRAFFASDGFGGGIPHQRDGSLLEGYDARFEFSADGGAFVVQNTQPWATYVIGDDQQPFHLDTGYQYLPRLVDEQIVPLVLNDYEQTWYSVADPFVRE